MVHPFLVVEVPAHGLFDAFLELQRGFPAQFVFQFARIDGIPQVVSGTVGDVGDELLAFAFGVAQEPIDGADDDFNQVDVLPFVESADIVGFGDAAFVEDQVDGAGVVFDVEPVADVLAFAVNGQRSAVADVVDEQRDQEIDRARSCSSSWLRSSASRRCRGRPARNGRMRLWPPNRGSGGRSGSLR